MDNRAGRRLWLCVPMALMLLGVGMQSPANARTSITTIPQWAGDSVGSFGKPNTATYGQTFTTPVDGEMSSFTVLMRLPTHVMFRGYVYEWDGAKPVGTGYETAPMTTSNPDIFQGVTFPVNFPVSAGQQYVVFASISKDYEEFADGTGQWGLMGDDSAHPGGNFVFMNNGNFGQLFTEPWDSFSKDLAFRVVIEDVTPPEITPSLTPAANAAGWHNSDVSLSWDVRDPESGIGSSTGCDPQTIASETAGVTFTCTAVNWGELSASESVTVKLDKTPPGLTGGRSPAPNADGWNNTDVTVTFDCTDALSGVASVTGPQTVSADGAGQSRSGTCADVARNSSSATVGDFSIDKTAPSISGTASPAPNADGWNNTDVTVAFDCSDATSGVATCSDDEVLNAEGAGQSAAGTVTDLAGNAASVTVENVNIDKTGPTTTVTLAPALVRPLDQTIDGTSVDNLSGTASVTVTLTDPLGSTTTLAATCAPGCATWTVAVPASLAPGLYVVTASGEDVAGNPGDASLPVAVLFV